MSLPAHRRLLCLLAAAALAATGFITGAHSTARAAPGSPALTPPLGWNSWTSFGCGVTETQVHQAADAMASSGMRDAGYRYVVVDDCWFDPQRDAAGNLRADPARFPGGMKALGDYIHARGLKFGNGTRVITWPCNGQDNQKWTVNPDGSIRNAHAGRCLDAYDAGTANGTPLVLWTCNSQANQKWTRA